MAYNLTGFGFGKPKDLARRDVEGVAASAVILKIASDAAALQEAFLQFIGLTPRQARKLSSVEKDKLQDRYREFLMHTV